MWGLRPKQASSATMALIYITVGALMVVWTVVYHVYLSRNDAPENAFLWNYGFFFTGVVLMVIGFAVGRIGRAARAAEVAPPVAPTVPAAPTAAANGTAAAPAAPVATPAPAAPAAPATAPPAAPAQPARTSGT